MANIQKNNKKVSDLQCSVSFCGHAFKNWSCLFEGLLSDLLSGQNSAQTLKFCLQKLTRKIVVIYAHDKIVQVDQKRCFCSKIQNSANRICPDMVMAESLVLQCASFWIQCLTDCTYYLVQKYNHVMSTFQMAFFFLSFSNRRSMNFDNPVYKKTTESNSSLDRISIHFGHSHGKCQSLLVSYILKILLQFS